ncbi:succinyldiaminopimelate transaminase [uncultured Tessaracoccus sp.]|uniref:succinyldiaminopimelate transaminase n=1 Tax=uncultured Tessaracoccus sp. TaxID=905023 RepID=UPI0025CCDDA7|nr:succinyldiaminopimelate transaminase [uncultured Tessaracoccus sp.]
MLPLPDFPWDSLARARARAEAHPGGIVDLSVGTPVDETPAVARAALADAADAHGYPPVTGTPSCRAAIAHHLRERWGASGLDDGAVLPVIGTKELVGWLPTFLGLGADDVVVFPEQAYPTYEIGALARGARPLPCDDPAAWPEGTRLAWINSPANPTGRIMGEDELCAALARARALGAVLASDECYGEFAWDREAVSVLDDRICAGDHTGLLAVHSVSKRSNAAGYRAGFVAGDRDLVEGILHLRKHLGMMVPAPVQAALAALLGDREHVEAQRARYLARRASLRAALVGAGFRIDDSEGGLYLWATRGEECRATVAWLAERGILVAPGDFYGVRARQHVRVALTAPDERIAEACARLA